MDMIEVQRRVRRILLGNRYLTLAICDQWGPWAIPLAYTITRDFEFVFYSSINSRHGLVFNINDQVGFAIFDSSLPSDDADGLQGQGIVSEVPESLVADVAANYFLNSFPDPEIRRNWVRSESDFTGDGPLRFYLIKPKSIFLPTLTEDRIDSRIEVSLDVAASALSDNDRRDSAWQS
jgi:hypothetical protein